MVNPIEAYQRTKAQTIDPGKLIVMCYDAIIKDLKEAKEYHEKRNLEASYDKIRHAQDIVTELLVALDYEQGGEIAINLGKIYNFLLRQFIIINSQTDPTFYDPLIKIVEELRDAWDQIARQSSSSISEAKGIKI